MVGELFVCICPGGSRRSGSIVPNPAAAWAFRSGPFAVCSSFMIPPTALSTANTVAERSQRAGGRVTESRVLPSGGLERGQRFGIHSGLNSVHCLDQFS